MGSILSELRLPAVMEQIGWNRLDSVPGQGPNKKISFTVLFNVFSLKSQYNVS